MRALVPAIALALVVGCGCEEPARPTTAPPTSVTPTASAPPTGAAPPPPSSVAPTSAPDDPVTAARDAYRDAINAFDARHADAYFAAFEPTLSCFYGQRDVPLDRVRRERWHDDAENGLLLSAQLAVLAHDDDQVVLLDRGFFRESRGTTGQRRQVMHQKIIVMHRDGTTWRIAAETSAAQRACLGAIVPDGSIHDDTFDSCRTRHEECFAHCGTCGDACVACMDDCASQALVCLGVRAPGAHGIVEAIPIRTEDDVRHFVQAELESESGEASEDDRAFVAGAERTLIAPYIGVTGWDASSPPVCAATLLRPVDGWMELSDATVSAVHCAQTETGALARCVVTFASGDRAIDATLLFDGQRLRAVHRDEVRDASAPAAALDRWATEHPPEWDVVCPAAFTALLEDRVGDDYFDVGSGEDDEGGDALTVERLCGPAARAAVVALGDDWTCDASGCNSPYGCGNECESVELDSHGRVLGHVDGMSNVSELDESIAARARAHIACGAHGVLSLDEDEDE